MRVARGHVLNRRKIEINTARLQRFDHLFGRDVADELVLGKGTTTQAANGRIESAAAGIVSRENFFDGSRTGAVQMRADFAIVNPGCTNDSSDQLGISDADRVGAEGRLKTQKAPRGAF